MNFPNILHSTFLLAICVTTGALTSPVVQAQAPTATDYPEKSIGGMTKKLNTQLQKPGARLIHHLATPPSSPGGGVRFSGLLFSSFDVCSVRTNATGNLLTLTIYSCEQKRGSNVVTKRRSLEIPDIDPNQFKSVVPSSHEALTDAIPAGSWVVVESKQTLNANQFLANGKSRKIVLPRFGMGFTTRAGANEVAKTWQDIQKRAEFEDKVKKLPELKSFLERSSLYDKINETLHEQGTKVGFFGAASAVTALFSVGMLNDAELRDRLEANPYMKEYPDMKMLAEQTGFTPASSAFMDQISMELAKINSEAALELLRTGKLTVDGRKLSDGVSIDKAMVAREQNYAEKKLNAMPPAEHLALAADITRSLNKSVETASLYRVTWLSTSLTVMRQILTQRRATFPAAKIDYNLLADRIEIGEKTAAKFR